jgi:hypothetical protein
MKRNNLFFGREIHRLYWIAALALPLLLTNACHPISKISHPPTHVENPYQPEKRKWIDWNVLFTPGTTEARQNQTMDSIKKYVSDSIGSPNPPFPVDQFFFRCPCDPDLINYTVTPLAASGALPVPPPPPGKGVGGSGDGIEYVNVNNSFIIDSVTENQDTVNQTPVPLVTSSVDDSKILAVMDTGLDSLYYQNHFQNLLWSDAAGQNIRNFIFYLNSRSLDYFWDDDKFKHGTAVTTLALQALESFNEKNHVKPRVMVLKVLDANRKGSTFSVSCATSYAIQHHATLINESLGYYGVTDSILLKYTDRTVSQSRTPITVFAAAGNLLERHFRDQLCFAPGKGNQLDSPRLFFPACFSVSHPNIITVTGLSNLSTACFYQNYSATYVNVGVVTNPGGSNCCKFKVPFNASGYEGSSFATPVLTGKIMGCLLSNSGNTVQSCLEIIAPVPIPIPPNPITKQGRFFTYLTP